MGLIPLCIFLGFLTDVLYGHVSLLVLQLQGFSILIAFIYFMLQAEMG
jgi:hypothetical protein